MLILISSSARQDGTLLGNASHKRSKADFDLYNPDTSRPLARRHFWPSSVPNSLFSRNYLLNEEVSLAKFLLLKPSLNNLIKPSYSQETPEQVITLISIQKPFNCRFGTLEDALI